MKSARLLLFLLLELPALAQAQFTFTTTNGAITITGFTGANANIPCTTNGYLVTSIGGYAFLHCMALSGDYFQGNSPARTNDFTTFENTPATVYYLPGTTDGLGSDV